MSIIIKTEEEIARLREAGKRHAKILQKLTTLIRPGVTTAALDDAAAELVTANGDTAAFFQYQPAGAPFPYPGHLCVSVNDEVVHGIPKESTVLQQGDIVSLDFGVKHEGVYTDAAVTVPVGKVTKEATELIHVTEEALHRGIAAAIAGNTVGDISAAVYQYARAAGVGVIDVLAGHGVGREIHEDPVIPNVGRAGTGPRLMPGMVIAIEPMLTAGPKEVVIDSDGYTYRTKQGCLSAHFEHTVLITTEKPEILTEA